MEAKLSVWSSYYMELEIENAIDEFIKNGIFCSELSDEHGLQLLERDTNVVATGKKLAGFLAEWNFEMSQGHLWLKVKICSDENAVEKLYKWIDLYEAIGIKNMVLHCDNLVGADCTKQERAQKNVEKLKKLAEYIKNKDITVCLENLRPHFPEEKGIDFSIEDLLYILDGVGSDKFGICLDTGHLNLTYKNHRHFILQAGKRLKALHIADNQGLTDQHLMPFNGGTVDFAAVVNALRQVNYNGLFNLEIPGERQIPLELRNAKLSYIKSCYNYLMRQ